MYLSVWITYFSMNKKIFCWQQLFYKTMCKKCLWTRLAFFHSLELRVKRESLTHKSEPREEWYSTLWGIPDSNFPTPVYYLSCIIVLAAPLHWNYDQDKVAELIKDNNDIAEFYPTSQCPFYTIPTGNNSTYGDQLYVSLRSIAKNKGKMNMYV